MASSSRKHKKRSKNSKWKPSPVSKSSPTEEESPSSEDVIDKDYEGDETVKKEEHCHPTRSEIMMLIGMAFAILVFVTVVDIHEETASEYVERIERTCTHRAIFLNESEFKKELQNLIRQAEQEDSIKSEAKEAFQKLKLERVPVRLFKEFIPDPTTFENVEMFANSSHPPNRQVLFLMSPEIKRVKPFRLKAFVDFPAVDMCGCGRIDCFEGKSRKRRIEFENGRINFYVDVYESEKKYTLKFVYYVPAHLL